MGYTTVEFRPENNTTYFYTGDTIIVQEIPLGYTTVEFRPEKEIKHYCTGDTTGYTIVEFRSENDIMHFCTRDTAGIYHTGVHTIQPINQKNLGLRAQKKLQYQE